jgi:hypothetical protein
MYMFQDLHPTLAGGVLGGFRETGSVKWTGNFTILRGPTTEE